MSVNRWFASEAFRMEGGVIVERKAGQPFSSNPAECFVDVVLASDHDAKCAEAERLPEANEHLWRVYEAIYGHRNTEGFDHWSTASKGTAAVVAQRDALRAEVETYRKALERIVRLGADMPDDAEEVRLAKAALAAGERAADQPSAVCWACNGSGIVRCEGQAINCPECNPVAEEEGK